ncbi:dihydroxyacetone kinase subunit DhaL [Aureimonas altamirensis]|uniref:dihydroxyacetone kinase subunit DhaL n=1 Tax=Aureimonas altamirensis TaxID=370622 RepID=UPI0030199030
MGRIESADLVDIFRVVSTRLSEARGWLGELDGAIGDADHGTSMAEGFAAIVRATRDAAAGGTPAGALFAIAARSFLSAVGATAGPLYASALLRAGQGIDDAESLSDRDIANLVPAMADGIRQRGKAAAGDKTMMDAWGPAARAVESALAAEALPLRALDAALEAAIEGRDSTRAMVASKGRAARLGERSLGHLDPGAASAVIVIEGLRDGLALILQRKGEAAR